MPQAETCGRTYRADCNARDYYRSFGQAPVGERKPYIVIIKCGTLSNAEIQMFKATGLFEDYSRRIQGGFKDGVRKFAEDLYCCVLISKYVNFT